MQILQRQLTQMLQYSPKVHNSQLSHDLTLEAVLNLHRFSIYINWKKSVCCSSLCAALILCGHYGDDGQHIETWAPHSNLCEEGPPLCSSVLLCRWRLCFRGSELLMTAAHRGAAMIL